MNAMLYFNFSSGEQLQACLYYFDPMISLPFADEVDADEADRVDAAEDLPTANGILPVSETSACIDVTLSDFDWADELDALRNFINRFKPELLVSYFDSRGDYSAFWVSGKNKWKSVYVVGEDEKFDETLYVFENNHDGWRQRISCFLTRAKLL